MARIEGKFIRGLVGNLVFKKYRTKQVIQGAPIYTAESQTAATKKAASIFGVTSRLACYIRDALYSMHIDMVDGPMVNRLNAEMVAVMNQVVNEDKKTFTFHQDSFSRLRGFEFNMTKPLRNILFVEPKQTVEENKLTISFPQIMIPRDFRFPDDVWKCMLYVGVGQLDLENGFYLSPSPQGMKIEFGTETPAAKDFTFDLEPGCLYIPTIFLQFYQNTFAGMRTLNSKKLNPVGILSATIADGIADPNKKGKWRPMKQDD
jgi:hypothetical protein